VSALTSGLYLKLKSLLACQELESAKASLAQCHALLLGACKVQIAVRGWAWR
jgi:hypothetical protein